MLGCCFGEGFDALTVIVDGADHGEWTEIDLVALGIINLRDQADVGERRLVTEAEIAGGVLDHGLDRLEAVRQPAVIPDQAL